MERHGSSLGTDSQDSDDLVPPGTSEFDTAAIKLPKALPATPIMSTKGIENAKKRLRAFSIQKKTPIAPMAMPKPVIAGGNTVLIGKLSSVKTTPKPEPEPDAKKIPKPPKPGGSRKNLQDSYTALQKRTLADIEDMKRKMELVELGIPLGLICPSSTSDKAMPTKAMPPIKSFLDATKLDEIIREAKKAKAEGREFKFDYQKLLPDYDNPFQRKKDDVIYPIEKEDLIEDSRSKSKSSRDRKDSRKSDRYDRRHSDYKKDDRDKDRYKDRDSKRDRERNKDNEKAKEKEDSKKVEIEEKPKVPKETDVNLNDYLVCDSWSLDNDDKMAGSPKVDGKLKVGSTTQQIEKARQAALLVKETLKIKEDSLDSPKPPKIEKLQPVMDSFKFEIDPNDDDALDIFDEDSALEKFNRPTSKKDLYDSPIDLKLFDYDQDMSKEGVIDANDDNFLESVINEIKQENMSDDTSQDKGLVEYDISPKDDYDDSKNDLSQGSVTPELDDRMRDLQSSQHSHYSDGYRSSESYKSAESGYKTSESGYKSAESGYKQMESGYKYGECGYKEARRSYTSKKGEYRSSSQSDDFRLSVEKELDEALEANRMSKSTVDSLETWSFVLKICQPLLFRHDKNKCYKETHTTPKIWFTENPKGCNCVKDRSVVYEELEMCKMGLVDRVYGCDQIPDEPFPTSRSWYPRGGAGGPAGALPPPSEWETEEASEPAAKSLTPQRAQPQDICLDTEYQKFMEAVWPEVAEGKTGDTSRSTTPVRLETRKKKKAEEADKESEDRKRKKMKMSSEGWSQESDLEEEDKPKKIKQEREKARKRKHSSSSESTLSDSEDEKKKKKMRKKGNKKLKAKLAKKRRISKKLKKQLKDKQKKKKKLGAKVQELSDDTDEMKEKKKAKKRKLLKQKKLQKKRKVKAKSSSSSSSSSSSDTDSEEERRKKIRKKELEARKKKKDKKKKKRKQSSDSTQSEELFDVNVLNNIKTERLTDDEKMATFSPRRQKPREIINVKELQNDFVGNNIHIKQEKIDELKEIEQESLKQKVQTTVEEEQPFLAVAKPVEAPVEATAIAKPVEATAIAKPVEATAIAKPVEATAVAKPIEATAIAKPVEATAVAKPVEATALAKPVEVTAVAKPLESQEPVLEKTVQLIAEEKPKEPVLVQESLQAPAVVKPLVSPVDKPEVQEPVFEAVDSKPDIKESIPELPQEMPQMKLEVSHMIPLPEDPKLTHNLEDIAMPPEKSIGTIETIQSISKFNYEVPSQSELYQKEIEACEDKFGDAYEQESYEMYEQMAMAYQSDVANQPVPALAQRIETVVRRRGEIKCDWRAGDQPAAAHAQHRPSRWGLKPGEVNIVLTGGPAEARSPPQQFRIRSVLDPASDARPAARADAAPMGYDEAYMDTYGAADRAQYGDCFVSSLDERINRVLQDTVLGEVAKETGDVDKDTPEKGILVNKSLGAPTRAAKRVSFADGYTPGQDSDVEEPPAKKRKKARRYGCAWPCPAAHPDHVPLWDALPPPPPPASPPPPPRAALPLHLLRTRPPGLGLPQLPQLPMPPVKMDPNSLPPFMPPEPPPGIINFQ